MMAAIDMSTLVAGIGWMLLHFVWQGALIACATGTLLVALRNARPELRYAVACTGLLLCLAWPLAELCLLLSGGRVPAAGGMPFAGALPRAAAADAAGWLAWLQQHLDWIVALWAACVGALGLRMACGLLWIGRVARGDGGDPAWQARLSALAACCGLTRAVRLRIVEGLASPVTAGWWRPVVLVPAALVAGMPPHLLEALLAHELGHIRRHDYLVNLLQNVVETILFYHPAVWWLSRRIRVEREQIADDFAARHLGEPRRLALALSELERLQFSGGHLAQAANGGDLLARIRRLLRPGTQALDWRAVVPVLGLALACAGSAHALANRHALAVDGHGAVRATTPALADFRTCARPAYPQADVAAGHEGTVTLRFLVDDTGAVRTSKVARSSGFPAMDEAAHGAIDKCRFRPALEDGRPVAAWTQVQYVWTLE
ncbi:M56 family metallopeptidase [uncultured Massilia sp.]|uniref:M56 family metallopeptidase n=1 Tax=uncultured Massilia sp. TaxID=169973 RepID=UPI0025E4F612|nr:M56 family metallopeptidase [uncultured Massilia sp.]